MTALPLCAQPGCLYAAVAGTDRCLPHTEPGKGDGSYHGVYHREGAWPAPEPAAEQAPVAARPYTEVTGIPIERADWEYFGRVARQAAPAADLDGDGDRCEINHVTRDNGGFSRSRCPNQALPGLDYCQPHTERYGVSPKPDGADDEATAEVLRIVQDDFARHEREYLYGKPLNVRPRGGITESGHVLPWTPYLQPALDELARQLAATGATIESVKVVAAPPRLPSPAAGGSPAPSAAIHNGPGSRRLWITIHITELEPR